MSGANVDKAQQVRPPIAVYAYSVGPQITIALPGVPGNIGGAAPQGSHGLLLNFLTIQNASVGGPSDQALCYLVNGDATTTLVPPTAPGVPPVAANYNAELAPNPPSPLSGQYAVLPPGDSVRFDLSYLYDRSQAPALAPVQYLHVQSVVSADPVNMRFWRSSGR